MKVLVAFFLITSSLLLLSCDSKSSPSDTSNPGKAVSSAAIKPSQIDAADFKGKLDELLTVEMAAKVSGFDKSKATKDYENKTAGFLGGKNAPPRECNYLWTNGRTRSVTIGGKTVNPPYLDKVGINSVANTTLERFKRNYRRLSDEEKEAAGKKLEEQANEKQPKQTDTEIGRKVTDIGTGLINNLQPEEINGVGQAAAWYPNFNELKVFYHGLSFALVIDITEDKSLNREKCIELERMIIDEKLK